MSRPKEFFILITSGGMELCWLNGLAFFILYTLGAGHFIFAGGLVAFWISAILDFYIQGRGWRIIQVLGLRAAGFVIVLLVALYSYRDWSFSFFSMEWLREAGSEFQNPMGGLVLILVAFFTALFWFSGKRFSRRSTSYFTVTSRFDLGVAVFFFLFLFGGGLGEQVPAVPFFLFPFFFFSMLSISLARSRGSGKKEYLLGFGKIGLVFLVCGVLLLLALGIVLLFRPGMSLLAETGYAFGRQLFSPLGTFLLKVIRFLYGGRSLGNNTAVNSGESGIESSIPEIIAGHEVQLWEKYFATGMLILLGAAVVIAVGWGLYHLGRRLFSKTAYREKKSLFWKYLLLGLLSLGKRCRKILLWFAALFSPPGDRGEGTRRYKKLLFWGKSGGFPRGATETPGEYGMRLAQSFPLFKEEIQLLIEAYHDEAYGELKLNVEREKRIRQAWRRLSTPLHWPIRLRTMFYPGARSQK